MDTVAPDLFLDHACASAQFSRNQSEINFVDAALSELDRQAAMRLIVFGHDQATARVLVEAMHNSGAFFAADPGKD